MSDCRCTKYAGKPPCIHDYATTVAELAADIAAVRELHQADGDGWCDHCSSQAYPCATIRALDGDILYQVKTSHGVSLLPASSHYASLLSQSSQDGEQE